MIARISERDFLASTAPVSWKEYNHLTLLMNIGGADCARQRSGRSTPGEE